MSLLQTDHINSKRQGPQPLNETSPCRLVSNPIAVKRKDRQGYGGREGGEQQATIGIWHRTSKLRHNLDSDATNNLECGTRDNTTATIGTLQRLVRLTK